MEEEIKQQTKPREKRSYDEYGYNIIRFLKSRFFAIVLSLILMLVQSMHLTSIMVKQSVFSGMDTGGVNWIYSMIVALCLEFLIIYFMLKESGKRKETFYSMSLFFAVFSVLINMYYYVDKICMINNEFIFSWSVVPYIGISIIIPLAVYKVSDEINS
jgi:peptidoglycan/LPS O-acetylase OafA/YrhL